MLCCRNDYFPLPAQRDVSRHVCRPYMVQPNTDWWVRFDPADNMKGHGEANV